MPQKHLTTPTWFFDYRHPEIQKRLAEWLEGSDHPVERAVRLFYRVRDGWRYNPYRISFRREDWRAGSILQREEGHCLEKAILLIAFLRGAGIPARLHLAKVKNHIAVERMIEKFGNDELTPHGFVELWLGDRWLQVVPAFNCELCERIGVQPLEFDGSADAMFQQYDRRGNRFMEYLEDYGAFDDVPLDFIFENMHENYPALKEWLNGRKVLVFE